MTLKNALVCLCSQDRFNPSLMWSDTGSLLGPWDVSGLGFTPHHQIEVISKRDLEKFKNDLATNSLGLVNPSQETIEKWIMDILPEAIEEAELTRKGF